MAAADVSISPQFSLASRLHQPFGFYSLFVCLCAFSLFTLDGGEIAPRLVSAVLFVAAALYFTVPPAQNLRIGLPAICLSLMACYGVAQTLWSPYKIVYNGWTGVLFWFTAALITWFAAQLFWDPEPASRFRRLFAIFASAVCVLDLLEQASQTGKYYWLIPSRYHNVFGPFAYWNNFAQFVELALPITLWLGLGHRRPRVPYLLLAAIQVAAVVASGSRAGTALIAAELFTVVLLAYAHNRSRAFLYGAALAIALSLAFVYAAGFDTIIAKLQQSDQLAVRRNIDRSSVAMIGAHPIVGWGLETYVPVYRKFALYDDGTYVNRAHNDWLQWAAEGGIPFAAVMLIVFVWSVRPAIRSVWGLGLIAICLHAIVDYPFARFGVCGWYFAMLPMLAHPSSWRSPVHASTESRRLRSGPNGAIAS